MLKKVAVAGLALVVGVAVLCWVCPVVGDWLKLQVNKGKDGIDNSVSLEDKIDILKNKLKDFDKEKVKYFDQVATAEREQKDLDAAVTKETGRLDGVWAGIQDRRKLLDSSDVRISYKGERSSKEDFEKKLTADFDAYQIDQKTLESNKNLLDARTKALENGKAQLATLESKKAELQAKLTNMEADLKLVRQQQAQANLSINDSDLDKLTADADALAGKITDQKRSLELQKEYGSHTDDAAPAKPAVQSDILKRIDAYKSAQDGPAAPAVADQK